MIKIKKIISGGQTGVDRGALDAAIKQGIETGGWCPPGRMADDGVVPDYYPLNETPYERSKKAQDIPRSLRTEWNVRDADATLILQPEEQEPDPGTAWTIKCCFSMSKSWLLANPFELSVHTQIQKWLNNIKPEVLNIAGPGEKTVPGIQKTAKELLVKILS